MANKAPDRSVYIRRRIVVLLGLAAVIAAIVLMFVKPGSGGPETDETQVAVPDDLLVTPDSEQPSDCSSSQLVVTPIVSQDAYEGDELPQLSLSVENTGKRECVADLGTAQLRFVIASGSDEVWRSVDCQKNPDARPVILGPGETLTTESIEWDRTRSTPDTCEEVREPVTAAGATYHLSATAAGVSSSGTAPFLLY